MTSIRTTEMEGSAYWYGPKLKSTDDWRRLLSDEEANELLSAISANRGRDIKEINASNFPLPRLSQLLKELAEQVDRGLGLTLLEGVPVQEMDEDDAAMALWGMGQYIGRPQIQDAAQSLLHHVRDKREGGWEENPNRRVYETNSEQAFHTDGGDMVMLLCRRAAKSGGTSRMVSAVTLFNEIIKRAPELAPVVQAPFHVDARGQQLPGRPRCQIHPIFIEHAGRMNVLHKRHYIDTAQRFEEVPALSQEQTRALDLIDEICTDPDVQLNFDMKPGDIQIACNFTILHSRDAFEDFPNLADRRHMLRLWLGLKEGRPLPEVYRETREYGPLFEIEGRASQS